MARRKKTKTPKAKSPVPAAKTPVPAATNRKPPARVSGEWGDLAARFQPAVRWQVDQDYSDKLTPAEARWLNDFNNAYYKGDFSRATLKQWPREERRKVGNRARPNRYDAMTFPWSVDAIEPDHVAPMARSDLSPTPAYLDDDAYKAAREEYRAALSPRRVPAEPKPSKTLDAALARLRKVTPDVDEE